RYVKPLRVNRIVHDVNVPGRDPVVLLEMFLHHPAVGDDQRPRWREILLAFQPGERPVRRIARLAESSKPALKRITMLVDIVLDRGRMQPALREQHIESPGLVEAD